MSKSSHAWHCLDPKVSGNAVSFVCLSLSDNFKADFNQDFPPKLTIFF